MRQPITRRFNPYANISLERPDILTPPPPPQMAQPQIPQAQPVNWMQFDTPQMEQPDTQGQVAGLGQSLLGLKRKFGAKQSGAIEDALKGGAGGGFGGGW